MTTAAPLQMLLFVDRRPGTRDQIRQIQTLIKQFEPCCAFDLQVVDVVDKPYMAEYFRLVATPALVKVYPEPRQTLAGSHILSQLSSWYPRWQRSAQEALIAAKVPPPIEVVLLDPSLTTHLNGTDRDLNAPQRVVDPTPSRAAPVATQNVPLVLSHQGEVLQLGDEVFRLRKDNEELLAQLQFKDQLIAMLAHDLRNPITATSIALETLETGLKPTSENHVVHLTPALISQLLKHARTQIRVLNGMITDILQATKGGTSELSIQPRSTDLCQIVLEVVESLRDRYESKSQTMSLDLPSDLPSVYADADRVKQVLVNLLDNAIKYTPISGTLTVSIVHRTTQKIQVSICDSGPGVPEEKRELIFADHFRLERDEQQDGYGIGLFLCQRIIRTHYGQIWVDAITPDQGSCFHFTLPVYRSRA